MSLPTPAQIEADIKGLFTNSQTVFMTFLQKVKTGAAVAEADVQETINAIASNIGTINSQLQQVESWISPPSIRRSPQPRPLLPASTLLRRL
jgi:hypothetical protein